MKNGRDRETEKKDDLSKVADRLIAVYKREFGVDWRSVYAETVRLHSDRS